MQKNKQFHISVKTGAATRSYTVELQVAQQYLGDVAGYEAQVSELESAVAEKEATISQQAQELESKEATIQSQQETIQALEAAYEEGVESNG